jgi:hypothetical protein
MDFERRAFALVQLIYEAAINAEVRAAFIYGLCQVMGLDVTHRHVITTQDTVLDICHRDPIALARLFPAAGEPAASQQVPGGGALVTTAQPLAQADLLGSPFFNDWLKPPHEDRGALVLLERSGESYDFGVFFRAAEGVIPGQLQALLDLLKPHCLAVGRLMQLTQRLELERGALTQALDHAPFGLLLLDDSGAVMECNAAAQAVLDGGLGLKRSSRGGLEASISREQPNLAALIDGAQRLAHDPAARAPAGALNLTRASQSTRLEVVAWPAVQRLSQTSLPARAEVALFIRDPATQAAADVPYEELKARYRLSKGEATVFNLLRRGLSVGDIADQLGVSAGMVRKYITSIGFKEKNR